MSFESHDIFIDHRLPLLYLYNYIIEPLTTYYTYTTYSGKILPIRHQFRLQNTRCSKVDGNKLVRLTVITFPASENSLSLEADVAGIAK